MATPLSPAEAWARLVAGNERFLRDEARHPDQDAARRADTQVNQHPFAVLFGCSDSRVAAEIIFDQGLGDLFVVRTAGHVLDTTVIGSIEYGTQVLGAPLVVVLGHDQCGAVRAAADALATGTLPDGFVRAVVDRVIPSIVQISPDIARGERALSAEDLGHEHVRHTVRMLHDYSAALARAVEEGAVAIVGAEYDLADGRVELTEVIGAIASA